MTSRKTHLIKPSGGRELIMIRHAIIEYFWIVKNWRLVRRIRVRRRFYSLASRTNIHPVSSSKDCWCVRRAAVTVTPKTNNKSEGCRNPTARLVVEGNSSRRCLCFMSFFMSISKHVSVCLCVWNLRVSMLMPLRFPFSCQFVALIRDLKTCLLRSPRAKENPSQAAKKYPPTRLSLRMIVE